jgi:hypothetical protein
MATNTCTSCGCKKCGCSDNALITPAPCPTPAGCPDPIACSEYFDAECIVYSGLDIECNNELVVATDTNLADALNDIIAFFCEFITEPDLGSIVEVCDNNYLDITSETNPETGVTTYTICFDPTNLPEVTLSGGTGINVTSNVVGNVTTYTVTNTDRGSLQNIFKNFAVAGQSTVIADSNNDTLTFIAGAGIQLTTNNITDTITITNSLAASAAKKYADLPTIPAAGSVVVTHNLNTTDVVVSVIDDNTNIALVHGVDYVWATVGLNTISVSDAAFGGGAVRVTVIG